MGEGNRRGAACLPAATCVVPSHGRGEERRWAAAPVSGDLEIGLGGETKMTAESTRLPRHSGVYVSAYMLRVSGLGWAEANDKTREVWAELILGIWLVNSLARSS